MPANHLILCRPLLLLPSVFPSIRVFTNESVLHIRWSEYWNFSFSISPSNEYSGLISFRIDWFNHLAVQGAQSSLWSNSHICIWLLQSDWGGVKKVRVLGELPEAINLHSNPLPTPTAGHGLINCIRTGKTAGVLRSGIRFIYSGGANTEGRAKVKTMMHPGKTRVYQQSFRNRVQKGRFLGQRIWVVSYWAESVSNAESGGKMWMRTDLPQDNCPCCSTEPKTLSCPLVSHTSAQSPFTFSLTPFLLKAFLISQIKLIISP